MTSVTLTRPGSRAGDFATLSREVRRAGLLERRRSYYVVRIVLNLAVFAAGWVVFVAIGDSWWQLLLAVFFAVMFTQFAFIGHDAGHKQIFHTRRGNDTVGYLHGGLVGLSYDWWVGKHTRHHANPNHEDDDPDLDIPALDGQAPGRPVLPGVAPRRDQPALVQHPARMTRRGPR